jgi:hypothetical protein
MTDIRNHRDGAHSPRANSKLPVCAGYLPAGHAARHGLRTLRPAVTALPSTTIGLVRTPDHCRGERRRCHREIEKTRSSFNLFCA